MRVPPVDLDELANLRRPILLTAGVKIADEYPTRFAGHVRRNNPSAASAINPPLPTQYRALLATLKLDDPVAALDGFDRAAELTAAANTVEAAPQPRTDTSRHLVAALAAGRLDPSADATRQKIDKALTPPTRPAEDPDEVYRRAAKDAFRNAANAIHRHGEQWLSPLRLAHSRALDEGDQATWDVVQQFAALLRQIGAFDEAVDASHYGEQFCARPDLLHRWQLERATSAKVIDTRWADNGRTLFVHRKPIGAPTITVDVLAEHRGDWRPGVYTGSEIATHLRAITAQRAA